MAAPYSVSRSVHVGRNGYLTGGIIRSQCIVGENTFARLGAVAAKDVVPGETIVGNSANPFRKKA